MADIESLELQITADVSKAEKSINSLINTLERLKKATGGGCGLGSVSKEMTNVGKTSPKFSSSTNNSSKSLANLGAKAMVAVYSLKKVTNVVSSWIKKSNDYVENLNLFTVSMGKYAASAQEYAEKVGDVLGIDPSTWMRNQGVFMTLATGFGVAGDRAATMSQQLTQLGYDISSFFNISVEDAMQKLQSGISGELEPLRRLGYDLSQAKLEAVALSLGIKKSVSSMTQAEKAELRYYAIMTQVTDSHGDMARTLEAPANQMRIFKSQITQTGRALGNVFIPMLNAVLPYAIAFLKIIRLVADSIAKLVGFTLPEIDYSGVTSGAGELSEAIDEATDSAKKMKRELLGIDELNVMTDTSSALDETLSGTGFDFELPTYDFIGEATNNKVNEIVDKMKEWLGITGEIDSWTDLLHTRFGKILTVVSAIGTAMAAWKVVKGVSAAFTALGGLFGKKTSLGSGAAGGVGGVSIKNTLKQLANIAILVGGIIALVGAIGLLTRIPGFTDTIQTGLKAITDVFTALAPAVVPMAVASVALYALGQIKVSTVSTGLANAAIVIGGVTVVITAVGALLSVSSLSDFLSNGIQSVVATFNGLCEIAVPIGLLSAYMAAVGLASPATMASGLAGFAIVIAGTEVVITAVGALLAIPHFSDFLSTGITGLQAMFKGLYEVAEPIGVLSALLAVLGIATPVVILSGLAGFALVVGGLELLLVVLGALKQIPGFTWIVGEGGKVLIQLGDILGQFAGSIVGGFASGVSASFPEIGKNLAGFMENAKPFFEGLENVNANSLSAVGNLAKMVLLLTAADVLDGLTSWFTGGNSLVDFGEDLVAFAPSFVEYAKLVSGVDASAVESSSIAAKAVAEFANNVPNSGGVAAWFAGENDIDVFGEKMVKFGKNFAEYSDAVKNVDSDVVTKSSDAAKSVVEFAKNIPNSGGVAAWFAGENDIDVFGRKMVVFGMNFSKYSDYMKNVDAGIVERSSNAAKSVVAFAKNIPNSGGVASWFAGENDIDVFGRKMLSFGENFSRYSNHMRNVNADVVTKSSDAAKSVVAFAHNIPNSGGVAAWFAGENDIDVFGKKMLTFGEKFAAYSNYIKTIDPDVVAKSSDAAASVVAFSKKIPNEGGVKAWFTGDNGIDVFGGKLLTFGKKFKEYYEEIKSISATTLTNISNCVGRLIDFAISIKDDVDISRMTKFTDALTKMGTAIKNLPTSKTISITLNQSGTASRDVVAGHLPLFASGAYDIPAGQAFIARESGPELVGTIGSRTAVVNNDQIVESVSKGVYQAVVSAMGQSGGNQVVEAKVNDKVLFEVVVNRNRQETIRTGHSPLFGGA